MKMSIALLFSLSCMSACGDTSGQASDSPAERDESAILLVASSKAVCQGVMQQLCLQVRASNGQGADEQRSSGEGYEFLYDGIAGFEFIWGHSYQLQIAMEPQKGAPQDAATMERRLVKVRGDKEDPAGAEYTYSGIALNPYTVTFDQGQYRFLGQAFVCRDQKSCKALAKAHKTSPQADLVFSYLGNGDIELVSWK